MDFVKFPSLTRFSQGWTVTEKIDGTNGCIAFDDDMNMFVGSRSRWLASGDDNFGFFAWANANEEELRKLGPGRHWGEWYGGKIQRGYGLKEKRFALFNAMRWQDAELRPKCCEVVHAFILNGYIDDHADTFESIMIDLKFNGSRQVPGFDNPEGIVCYHSKSGTSFKKTFDYDEYGKWIETNPR